MEVVKKTEREGKPVFEVRQVLGPLTTTLWVSPDGKVQASQTDPIKATLARTTRDKAVAMPDGTVDIFSSGMFAVPELPPGQALRDALQRLGLSASAVTEGVATVLGVSAQQLREPDAPTVARVDPEQLGVLLPFLVEHEDPEIRRIGERWIDCPGAAFQLPPAAVERWLAEAGRMGDLLAPRVRDQGLALLGPDALLRLSRSSSRPPVRRAAAQWLARLT